MLDHPASSVVSVIFFLFSGRGEEKRVAGRLNNRAEELWVGGQRSGLDSKVGCEWNAGIIIWEYGRTVGKVNTTPKSSIFSYLLSDVA
jgi:hypothetical protein